VISTLSSAVQSLEGATSDQFEASGDARHLDQAAHNDSPLQFPSHLLSGKFKPFTPPPAPVPQSKVQVSDINLDQQFQRIGKQWQQPPFQAVDFSNLHKQVVPRTENSPIRAPPARFLERMRQRQVRWEEFRSGLFDQVIKEDAVQRGVFWAISVKRQRKLKMKKHKYKKLMRKTRNLRRRLDRV
jgi:Mitochondrial domain of unknown function (DUF1713)